MSTCTVAKGHNQASSAGGNDSGVSFLRTLPYVLVFFSAMVFHELALEAASASYGDYDSLASTVTLFQLGFCVLIPLAVSKGVAASDFPRSPAAVFPYMKLSILVYGATALATQSLVYPGITYVTKVVFKSAKLIPTMFVNVFLNGDRGKYGPGDYASALLLCAGAVGFCFGPGDAGDSENEGKESANDVSATSSEGREHWMGLALLTISVVCDALVPNLQEQLMKRNPTPTPPLSLKSSLKGINDDIELEMKNLLRDENGRVADDGPDGSDETITKKSEGLSATSLMVNVNAIGFACLLFSMVAYGSLLESVRFVSLHPQLLAYLLVVGCGLGSAVLAYTELIRRSGPAAAVAVATLRKVATVILSYIVFPKPLTYVHALSGVAVLGGMVLVLMTRRRR